MIPLATTQSVLAAGAACAALARPVAEPTPMWAFADVSATVLEALGCREKLDGTSFLKDVLLKDE